MDIATAKLRTFHLRWGNGNLDATAEDDDATGAPEAPDTLLVHTGRWQAQRVPLARDGVMKHLGVHWDMRYRGKAVLNLITERLESVIARLIIFSCANEVKQAVLERCVFPSLLYQRKFANWPLATYRLLDVKVNTLIKKMCKFPTSFPTELLYLGKSHGGMNFKRLSDAAHIAKLSLLHRYQGSWADKALSAKVMCSLIGRAARTAGNGPPPHELCGIMEGMDGGQAA